MNYEQEEEFLTNDLSRKLMQVEHKESTNHPKFIKLNIIDFCGWLMQLHGLNMHWV